MIHFITVPFCPLLDNSKNRHPETELYDIYPAFDEILVMQYVIDKVIKNLKFFFFFIFYHACFIKSFTIAAIDYIYLKGNKILWRLLVINNPSKIKQLKFSRIL